MTEREKKFLEHWDSERKNWKWGENFRRTSLYFVLPIVILIDTINFFIIGDANYAYISFIHLWDLITDFFILSLTIGFLFNFFRWNINETRYWRIVRKGKEESERQ
jgi:hypothetical protein